MENEIKDSRGDAERQRAQSETHAAVIDEMHGFKCRNLATGELEECTCISKYLADRAEAAHKREVEKLNSVIQATVSRSDAEIDRLRREVAELRKQIGNAAKLREAVEAISKAFDDALICTDYQMSAEEHDRLDAIYRQVKEALSAPPRNCDRLSADKCKQIFKSEMEVYLPQEATDNDREIAQRTAYGVIDALFAPYTEQEGEKDGSK